MVVEVAQHVPPDTPGRRVEADVAALEEQYTLSPGYNTGDEADRGTPKGRELADLTNDDPPSEIDAVQQRAAETKEPVADNPGKSTETAETVQPDPSPPATERHDQEAAEEESPEEPVLPRAAGTLAAEQAVDHTETKPTEVQQQPEEEPPEHRNKTIATHAGSAATIKTIKEEPPLGDTVASDAEYHAAASSSGKVLSPADIAAKVARTRTSDRAERSPADVGAGKGGSTPPPDRPGGPESHDDGEKDDRELKRAAYEEARSFRLPAGWEAGRQDVDGFAIDAAPRDCDDMIALKVHPDGSRTHKVSIADTSFLQGYPDILAYAEHRGESRYLPGNRVDPMLPPTISEHKLSLLENQPTPVVTITTEIDPEGNPITSGISLGVGHARNMTYDRVDKLVRGEGDPNEVQQFQEQFTLAQQLIAQRAQGGAVAIYDRELGLRTDAEGNIVEMPKGTGHPAQLIVQESMILANSAFSEYATRHDIPFIYRNYAYGDPAVIQAGLAALRDASIEEREQIVRDMQRNFGRATFDTVPMGHDGLNLPSYAQVTSPGRRWGDTINIGNLVAHNQNPEAPEYPFPASILPGQTEHLNAVRLDVRRETRAAEQVVDDRAAEREANVALGREAAALVALPPDKFDDAAQLAARRPEVPTAFGKAFAERLTNGEVHPSSLSKLLMSKYADSPAWESVIAPALSYLRDHPHVAISVLNHADQQRSLSAVSIDATPTGLPTEPHFDGVATMTDVRGQVFRAVATDAPSRAAARGAAAANLLAARVGRLPQESTEPFQRAGPSVQFVDTSFDTGLPELTAPPKSVVLEFFTRQANQQRIPISEIVRFDEPTPIPGGFESRLTIMIQGSPQEFIGRMPRKKDAETAAATKAALALGLNQRERQAPAPPTWRRIPTSSNPVTDLKIAEDKRHVMGVNYTDGYQDGDDWVVEVTVVASDGTPRAATGRGPNIKAAKKSAAWNVLHPPKEA